MAEANGNGWRSYAPLIISAVVAIAPVLVLSSRMINSLDYLEATVRERGAEIDERFDQAIDQSNARWTARDRQAKSGDQRIRALAEALIRNQVISLLRVLQCSTNEAIERMLNSDWSDWPSGSARWNGLWAYRECRSSGIPGKLCSPGSALSPQRTSSASRSGNSATCGGVLPSGTISRPFATSAT